MRLVIFLLLIAFLNCPAYTAPDDKGVYLYIIDGRAQRHRVKMPNYQDCWETISHSKISGPTSGKHIKSAALMFCAGEDWQRHYNSTWFRDKFKDLRIEGR